MKIFKNFFSSPDKKRLFSNFVSLSVLQGANYILPLITLPYLVRVLGPEKFGLIAFAQAFIQYFVILTDYGFNLSATREISIYRENRQKIQEIFSSVMIIKLILTIISVIILSIIVFSFEKFRNDWGIYFLTFGMVIGQVLLPVWFFQGMERMKYITFLNITAKIIFTVSIFIFVHKASDYIYVPLLNSLGFIVAGIMALWIVFRDFRVDFRFPSLYVLKYQLKEGGHIFLSRISISFYTVSNIFILGLLTNSTIVAYYSVAERLVNVVKNLNSIVLQVMFPFISKLAVDTKNNALIFIRKEIKFFTSVGIIMCIFIIILSKPVVFLLFGGNFGNSIPILQVLSITSVITLLSAIIGQQILLNFNLKKLFTLSIIFPSIIHLFMLFVFVNFWNAFGAAVAVVITESFILIIRLYFLRKQRPDIFKTILWR